jgi:hypothetical protein
MHAGKVIFTLKLREGQEGEGRGSTRHEVFRFQSQVSTNRAPSGRDVAKKEDLVAVLLA